MLSKLFAGLAAKIMGGIIVALLLSNIGGCVYKNRQISAAKAALATANKNIESLQAANATLRGNSAVLEAGLSTCNASLENAAKVANVVAQAGVDALKEVQKAGSSVDRKVREIDAMPKETCEDAFKILKKQ